MADTPQRTDPNAPVLVVGLGRFGAATAEELVAQGREVLAVERDPVLVQRFAPSLTHVVEADALGEDESGVLIHMQALLRRHADEWRRFVAAQGENSFLARYAASVAA